MELSRRANLAQREQIECWDDDDDIGGFENLQLRNASTATTATAASSRTPHHRESTSSRVSARSDLEEEGDWQLLLPDDTEAATKTAVENAKKKGIPLPANVPSSALLGGTIRKLGGRKISKAMIRDDWGEDIEMPAPGNGGLKLKMNDGKEFPPSLRQVSASTSSNTSPSKTKGSLTFMERLQAAGTANVLDKFKDAGEDDFFDDVPTIKVAKNRSPMKLPNFTSSPAKPKITEDEEFEDDFDLPIGGTLKLSARKEAPKTPLPQVFDDVDTEWADGSQGSLNTSLGGSRRVGKSARSSSISARSPSVFSPSLSSCLTAESEDEGLDGLVLPEGPLKLEEALKKRMRNTSPGVAEPTKVEILSPTKDDFFDDIDFGHGELFDSGKVTSNRNIKYKANGSTSPSKRTATSLTFTNRVPTANTRIPKPRPKLEPVLESGAPSNYYNSHSRLGNHSTQSSVSSIPTPTPNTLPPSSGPSTPRKSLTTRKSRDVLRSEPGSSTSAQLLKAKRSLPVLGSKAPASPVRPPPPFQRPPSRTEKYARPTISSSRPKTPVDRSESSLAQARKPPVPFLPAGGVHAYSHHVSTSRTSRPYHRPTSSDSTSNENAPLNTRSMSRLSDQYRAGTPTIRRNIAPEPLAKAAAAKKQVTKPLRRHGFGDGSELDAFDDLPTSATSESKFLKHPTGSLRSNTTSRPKLYSIPNLSSTSIARSETTPRQPLSPQKNDYSLPSFARSTAASRLAREQRLGQSVPQPHRQPSVPEFKEAPMTNWKAVVNAKPITSPRHTKRTSKHPKKPQLIKPLGNSATENKIVNGMHWNPQLFRWEGNENALAPFDVPSSPRRAGPSPMNKPALIANPGSVKGVQVVGGMVFDPEKMRWLKIAPQSRGRSESGVASITTEDDEDDPFAGIDDLEDETKSRTGHGLHGKASMSDEEPMVGEEFDVGPDFVRRQEKEEDKWRRKLQGWTKILGQQQRAVDARNDIRTLVQQ
ncbi:hypothetical protein MMC10_000028 [Thelotrema lepadinum]|nr:hypothetical protein [Thelotrema lepadinum]